MYLFNTIEKKDIYDAMLLALKTKEEKDRNLIVSKLLFFALEEGFNGNIWKKYLLYTLIFNENAYTKAIEKRKNSFILDFTKKDLLKYYDLYCLNESWMKEIMNLNFPIEETPISKEVDELYAKINSYESFEKSILSFYKEKGIGDMAIYKAFRVHQGLLSPIVNVLNVTFNDLIGYDEQKKLLMENTKNFIAGRPFNNVLLYGDSGTGKSTSIKALLNLYFDQGLRMIEVYKHQMEEISKIISQLKERPYFYIIYMDDLSFEEDESEYKYLKSVIEGGIEPKPTNVAIYATSNRRHLIKETFKDNQTDDLHRNETQAEKLSLAYRFGLQIFYSSLSPKEFKNMVKELAEKYNLNIEIDQLLLEASKWELTYGSLSGRCAVQFINYISNKLKK